jgi:ASPIC and UnbV/FG-GAP-like repeat
LKPKATTQKANATKPPRTKRPVRLLIAAGLLAGFVAWALYDARRPRFDMVATLAGFGAQEGVWDNQWDKAKEKLAELRAGLATEKDPSRRFALKRLIATHALFDGDADAAIQTLEEVQREYAGAMPPGLAEAVKADLAFAHMRRGETENCAEHHTSASCLFPIQGEGVHKLKRGSTEAVRLYNELLADPKTDPENALSYRWLLNLGYQTLGQYPEQVPRQWLIPPEAFKSDYDIGRFPEEAASRGVAEFGAAGGIVLEDFDNDGHLDVMISHFGIGDQLEYFHNNGDGTFTRMTEQAGLKGIVGGLNLVSADYNNDGCIDVLLLRGAWLHENGKFPPSLLRNNCDGTFTDVTAQAGLLSYLPTQTAAWADINNDGYLDLFVGFEINKRVAWPPGTKNFLLYLNNGNGTFTEVGANSGIQLAGMVKGSTWGDYDNDGWPDLYVSILGGPNHLFRNLGTSKGGMPAFADVTARAGVAEPLESFTTWFWDYNNDGWPDIFVTGYAASLPNLVREYIGQKEQAKGEKPRLYRNNKDGTFTDVSREVGLDKLLLTMGANFGDLDNDGYPDFYVGTGQPNLAYLIPNRMFRNDQGKTFQDVTTSGGFGHLQKGHAVAFGDVDNSGNQDVVEVMGGVYQSDKFWTAFYKNPGHGNHWVKLNLVGVKANRFGVGARLRLVLKAADGTRREVFSTVSSGGSFGASSLRPHLGLGTSTDIELLEVKWPGSGTVQTFKGLAADQTYEIREDQPSARSVTWGAKASARAAK